MKVIVAGFSKTGTKSMSAALTMLGYNVYDHFENVTILLDQWDKIFREGWKTEDFRRMYENVDAVTDSPAFFFWEEIHKAFPDAKIILMTRDEDSWFHSFENHMSVTDGNIMLLLMRYLSSTARKTLAKIDQMGPYILGIDTTPRFRKKKLNKELMKLKFRAHNAYVLQNAPPDKLFIYECSQGWKPLCDFLEVAIPKEEFPHKNKNASFMKEAPEEAKRYMQTLRREMLVSMTVITAGVAIGSYLLWTRGPYALFNSGKNACKNIASHLGLHST